MCIKKYIQEVLNFTSNLKLYNYVLKNYKIDTLLDLWFQKNLESNQIYTFYNIHCVHQMDILPAIMLQSSTRKNKILSIEGKSIDIARIQYIDQHIIQSKFVFYEHLKQKRKRQIIT
jgi:hypothetical protein